MDSVFLILEHTGDRPQVFTFLLDAVDGIQLVARIRTRARQNGHKCESRGSSTNVLMLDPVSGTELQTAIR
jgi:hypothetical protein